MFYTAQVEFSTQLVCEEPGADAVSSVVRGRLEQGVGCVLEGVREGVVSAAVGGGCELRAVGKEEGVGQVYC